MRTRRFTWTHFDFGDRKTIEELDVRYLIYGEETCPTTKRLHMQGYLEIDKPKTVSAVLKNIFRFNKLFVSKGTLYDNIKYCSKEGKVFEKGQPVEQGERTDFKNIYELIKNGGDMNDVDEQFPEIAIKYSTGVEKMIQRANARASAEELREEYEEVKLRPWQEKLFNMLHEKPDKRKIYWYYDRVGGMGKSWFVEFIDTTDLKCHTFTHTKSADVAYAIKGTEKVFIFDLARKLEDMVNTQIIECVKNGRVFSTKYQSIVKKFCKPHVIVFANFKPVEGGFSEDKLILIDMEKM